MALPPARLANYPYFLAIGRDDQATSISIEQIRELQHFTQLKTTGDGDIRRVIIVSEAGRLTTEAQNALLKLLEEPPADTMLLLTIENERALLPTIMSRVQLLPMLPAPVAAVRAYFAVTFEQDTIDKAYFLSGGLPGLMHALLTDEQSHPLLAAVAQAKDILQKPAFDRLVLADALSKKKDEARYVLQALRQIAETCLAQATKQQDTGKIRRWHGIAKAAYRAERQLAGSVNAKLALTNLMLAL